ncbi:MAG: hypothetical protein HY526_03955 [Betaproteobacteria bacterium]|nr:hypothetical protein [Betaproteobacteria bacterium]
MRNPHPIRLFPKVLIASLLIGYAVLLGAAAGPQSDPVKVEWLGWSFYRFTSPSGKVILTNPFITGNADAAVKVEEISKADVILVPNGHGDEIGDTVAIARATGAKIVAPFELGTWFTTKGVPEAQVLRRNPGTRLLWEGLTIRVVGSVHGSGSGRDTASDRAPFYGGAAAGFIITFENGWTVYFPGSSAATQDMALWADAYKPDAMIFLMHPSGEPRDAGMAIKLVTTNNPNLKVLFPQHHRVMPPPGALTISEVRTVLDSMGIRIPITDPVRKQVYEFTK